MREIKFRAWHTPFSVKRFGAGYVYGNKVVAFNDMSPDKYNLEQYTGLKDRKGNEIYEGDIMRDPQYGRVVGVVKFDVPMGAWRCGSDSLSESSYWEIIGNVNENPNLVSRL